MMTTQEQFFDFARQGQESLTKAITDWTDIVRDYTLQLTEANRLPEPKEAVERTFDLFERLLRTQRELATGLVAAATSTES